MDSTEQSPLVTAVTKPKHPGRVAQGHKLAALMKQRKEALIQNIDSEVEPADSEVSSVGGKSSTSYGLLAIAGVVGVTGAAYIVYRHYSKTLTTKADDMFKMH